MQQVVGVMVTKTLFKAILPNLKNCPLEVLYPFFPGRDQYYDVVFVGFVVPGAPEGSTE